VHTGDGTEGAGDVQDSTAVLGVAARSLDAWHPGQPESQAPPVSTDDVLALQRTVGNKAVTDLLATEGRDGGICAPQAPGPGAGARGQPSNQTEPVTPRSVQRHQGVDPDIVSVHGLTESERADVPSAEEAQALKRESADVFHEWQTLHNLALTAARAHQPEDSEGATRRNQLELRQREIRRRLKLRAKADDETTLEGNHIPGNAEAWFSNVHATTFLDKPVTVHDELGARLTTAEGELRSEPAPSGGWIDHATSTLRDPGQGLHGFGLAIDINPGQNPFLLNPDDPNSTLYEPKAQSVSVDDVIERAVLLTRARDKKDEAFYAKPEAPDTDARVGATYDKLSDASDALVEYLGLVAPSKRPQLEDLVRALGPRDPKGRSADEWLRTIRTDKASIDASAGNKSWDNPEQGLLHMDKRLVQAMTDSAGAGLTWLGDETVASGRDTMHFDTRGVGPITRMYSTDGGGWVNLGGGRPVQRDTGHPDGADGHQRADQDTTPVVQRAPASTDAYSAEAAAGVQQSWAHGSVSDTQTTSDIEMQAYFRWRNVARKAIAQMSAANQVPLKQWISDFEAFERWSLRHPAGAAQPAAGNAPPAPAPVDPGPAPAALATAQVAHTPVGDAPRPAFRAVHEWKVTMPDGTAMPAYRDDPIRRQYAEMVTEAGGVDTPDTSSRLSELAKPDPQHPNDPTKMDNLFQTANITDAAQQKALMRVSANEAGLNNVQTYDTGFVTFGAVGFTTGKFGTGTIIKLLKQMKRDDPDGYRTLFHDLGIDFQKKAGEDALVVVDPTSGARLVGEDAVNKVIEDKRLTAVFANAANKSQVLQADELKTAIAEYWQLNKSFTITYHEGNSDTTISGQVSDVVTSQAGAVALFDRSVNYGPGGAMERFRARCTDIARRHKLQTAADLAKYEIDIIRGFTTRLDVLADGDLSQPPAAPVPAPANNPPPPGPGAAP
jgi:hypothetical protein